MGFYSGNYSWNSILLNRGSLSNDSISTLVSLLYCFYRTVFVC